jgi:DNA replication protein DnaC
MSAGAETSQFAARIRELCRRFHLPTVAAEAEPRFVAAGQAPALPTLAEVLELEAEDRRARRVTRLRYASKLPPGKTEASFDPTRLPPKLQHQLGELASGAFLERSANLLAFGLPGTGKSHLAQAIGHAAIQQGHRVLYREAHALIEELAEASLDGTRKERMAELASIPLLIVDDLGMRKLPATAAEDLLELIMRRYERASTLLASNRPVDDWGRLLGDTAAVTAMLDRLLHHAHLLKFGPRSWRTRQPGVAAAKASS